MQRLDQTYNTSIEAVNATLMNITKPLNAIHVDYLPGENRQDPNDLHIAVWMLMGNDIYCYYIRAENKEWVTRKCDRQDFNETTFISCPLHFLKSVDLVGYDLAWIEAVRQYHKNLPNK